MKQVGREHIYHILGFKGSKSSHGQRSIIKKSVFVDGRVARLGSRDGWIYE